MLKKIKVFISFYNKIAMWNYIVTYLKQQDKNSSLAAIHKVASRYSDLSVFSGQMLLFVPFNSTLRIQGTGDECLMP